MSIKSVKPSGGSPVFCLPAVLAAAGLPWTLGDQPQNRNQPQVHRALDALSPPDAVSRARLRMKVSEALVRPVS